MVPLACNVCVSLYVCVCVCPLYSLSLYIYIYIYISLSLILSLSRRASERAWDKEVHCVDISFNSRDQSTQSTFPCVAGCRRMLVRSGKRKKLAGREITHTKPQKHNPHRQKHTGTLRTNSDTNTRKHTQTHANTRRTLPGHRKRKCRTLAT